VLVDSADGSTFPLRLDVTTTGPEFNQQVTVNAGSGRANMINWFVTDSASVNAHETGHMLGLFDEYIGGAVDRYPNPTLTATGLMGLGALSADPEMLPRYYGQYVDFVSSLNPDHAFALSEVPEPATLVMLSVGLAVVVMATRGFRTPRF
jgi:hypothetical protein